MPKIVSRNVVSQSAEDTLETDPNKVLNTYYCLCGEFSLVLQGPIESLARRPVDGSHVLRNEGEKKRVYKLNAVGSKRKGEGEGVLVMRGREFEFQRSLNCPRCALQIAYETTPGQGTKGPATFLLAGALSDIQNQAPEGAFGPEDGDEDGGGGEEVVMMMSEKSGGGP